MIFAVSSSLVYAGGHGGRGGYHGGGYGGRGYTYNHGGRGYYGGRGYGYNTSGHVRYDNGWGGYRGCSDRYYGGHWYRYGWYDNSWCWYPLAVGVAVVGTAIVVDRVVEAVLPSPPSTVIVVNPAPAPICRRVPVRRYETDQWGRVTRIIDTYETVCPQ
jgi:hypothetical protein